MKSILVLTDFSKCAGNAMLYALELAKRNGAAVNAINLIYPTEDVDSSLYSTYFVGNYIGVKKETMNRWIRKYKKMEAYQDVQINGACEVGFMPNSIERYVENYKADVVVMGTMGASGIAGILGSNAAQLVAAVKVPTLLVPPLARFKEKSKICLSADFDTILQDNNKKVLKEFLEAHRTDTLEVLHVIRDEEKVNKKIEGKIKDAIHHQLSYQFHYTHDSNVAQAINNFVETDNIDVLCSITHHHSFLYRLFVRKSVTKSMALKAIKPIFVLHEA